MKKNCGRVLLSTAVICFLFLSVLAGRGNTAEERLIIKDSSDKVFSFQDNGLLSLNPNGTSSAMLRSYTSLSTRLDIGYDGNGGGNLECYSKDDPTRAGQFKFIYGGGPSIGYIVFTHYDGSSWNDKMTLDYNGKLTMWNGAYCDGYGWYTGSSREYKDEIKDLTTENALETLKKLKPVTFHYKTDPDNKQKVGFIAEDVPEIVAAKDRKGVSAIDFVAILTKVVQEQQKNIAELTKKLNSLQQQVKLNEDKRLGSNQ